MKAYASSSIRALVDNLNRFIWIVPHTLYSDLRKVYFRKGDISESKDQRAC